MLWAIAAAMAGVVVVAILSPFLARRAGGEGRRLPAAAYDLRVYRSQLAEVDRDLTRGVIAEDEARRLKVEIGRKVLEADRALSRAAGGGAATGRPAGLAVAAALLVLTVGAFALYQRIGAPGMPDDPIALRAAAANRAYDSRPSQAEAEALAAKTRPAPPPVPADYAALIDKLRKTVAGRPDDPQGLALLAEHESRLGRPVEAATAMRHLLEVKGTAATAEEHTRLAGMLIEAAGGVITAEAEAELARALRLDPAQPWARYLQGVLMIQNQRPDRAFPIWRALLEAGPPEAPWNVPIRQEIGTLAYFAGQPDYQPPGAAMAGGMGGPMMPGPDSAAVAAAGEMSAADRQQMIAGMVQRLETRLAEQGGTADEWARLITALHVQGNDAHAAEILAEARGRFVADAQGLAVIEDAARKAALK